MQIKYFTERPVDEYNNVGFTVNQRCVIKAAYERYPGTIGSLGRLHVLEPQWLKDRWPTLSELYFVEVAGPARDLAMAEWLELVGGD